MGSMWFSFVNPEAEVLIRNLEGNVPYLIIKSEHDIGMDSQFGKRIIECNLQNQKKYDGWINFLYSNELNVWYRPVRALSFADLNPYFAKSIKFTSSILNVESLSGEKINVRTPDTSSILPTHGRTESDPNSRASAPGVARPGDGNFTVKTRQTTSISGGPGEQLRIDGEESDAGIAKHVDNHDVTDPSFDLGSANTGTDVKPSNYFPASRGVDDIRRSPKERVEANIRAIKLIRGANQNAISEEKIDDLAAFSGWGGLSSYLVSSTFQDELNSELSNKERRGIYDSALYGYFTPNRLIAAVWDLLVEKGYKGGRVFEPSCATGKFLTQRRPELDFAQHFTGVEIDNISAQICKNLNPAAVIFNDGLENVFPRKIKKDSFDIVVGNFPFGEMRLVDEVGVSRSIHNHFLLKSIEAVRPGGVVSVISSTHTLDAESVEFRTEISKQAQLLAAVRMPDDVFEGTSVQSDILIFRRRTFDELDLQYEDINFVELAEIHVPAIRDFDLIKDNEIQSVKKGELLELKINSCFVNNNDKCLISGAQFAGLVGKGNKLGLILKGKLEAVTDSLNAIREDNRKWFDDENLYLKYGLPQYGVENGDVISVETKPVVGSLILHNNDIFVVDGFTQESNHSYSVSVIKCSLPSTVKGYRNSFGSPIEPRLAIRDYIEVRDAVIQLIEADHVQSESASTLRRELNDLYDRYVTNYGYFNNSVIRKLIRNDAMVGYALGLEHYDSEDESKTTKAEFLSKSTVKRVVIPDFADSLQDAVSISLNLKGKVDPALIETLTKKSIADLVLAEPEIIFLNPVNGKWEHRTTYLTGNVVSKLNYILKNNLDATKYADNLKCLESARPPQLSAKDIGVSLGSTWIPNQILVDYLSTPFRQHGVTVKCLVTEGTSESPRTLSIEHVSGPRTKFTDVLLNTHGVAKCSFARIAESLITSSPIRITVKTPAGIELDKEATLLANAKRDFIKEDFERWVLRNEEVANQIEEIYNNTINVYSYDVSYDDVDYQFPNISENWTPRKHQKTFVLNALLNGNRLNADCVGAGKTGMQVMLAYELKRLGIARFPTIVVPNHMLYQTASEAQNIYPSAKICVVTKEDLNKENRSAFVAKMTLNDWDFAVITYSMFTEITPPTDYLLDKMHTTLADYSEQLRELGSGSEDRLSSRDIIKKIKKMEERIKSFTEDLEKNKFPIELDKIGIDACLYDEFHKLKNLELNIIKQIPGISNPGSQIAYNEYIKMQYVMDTYYGGDEKGIFAFTATPFSNSIAELYTVGRYLKPSIWESQKIRNFNEWASQYGEIVTALEVMPEGGGFQLKSRLSSFINVPELLASFRSFSQVNSREDLNLPVPKYEEINVVVEPHKWGKYLFKTLIQRATTLRTSSNSSDNFLAIVGDASMASINPRAMNPMIPQEESKVSTCANNVFEIYKATVDIKGTQLVFCDRSTPTRGDNSSGDDLRQFMNLLRGCGVDEGDAQAILNIKLNPKADSKLALEGILAPYEVADNVLDVVLNKMVKLPQYSAYNELKEHLVSKGIKSEEIAFIHDAKTDEQRHVLQNKVRNGLIRVLMGSTEKLGTGTNVQRYLVALHDLDIPWTQKELEQRLGRAVRQGNENGFVKIFRYLTKGSFDVFRLETIKRKAKAILIAMSNPRNAERRFSEETNIDYDTMIAEATDNPIVRERATIAAKLSKLERIADNFYSNLLSQKRERDQAERTVFQFEPKLNDMLSALQRINCHLKTIPIAPLPEEGDQSQSKVNKIKQRNVLAQASFTSPPSNITGIGETVWLDQKAIHEQLLAAVDSGNQYAFRIYGEDISIQYTSMTLHLSASYNGVEYYDNSYNVDKKRVPSVVFEVMVHSLPERVRYLRERVKTAKEKFKWLSEIDFDIKFERDDELHRLRAEKGRIELEIAELSKNKQDGDDFELPSIAQMLQLYESSDDKESFDPNVPDSWDESPFTKSHVSELSLD